VYPLWIWLAIRTCDVLRFVTGKNIPFGKHTIWLIKILALIIGAGGTLGAPTEIGLSWHFGIVPAGLIIFFSLTEKVNEITFPRPQHDAAAYQAGWNEYRRLRAKGARAYLASGIVLIAFVVVARLGENITKRFEIAIVVFAVVALLAAFALMCSAQWQLIHWPCPRCGCAYRGLWISFFMPKRCRNCGLPRWEVNPTAKA
jgi:hypothetical protein